MIPVPDEKFGGSTATLPTLVARFPAVHPASGLGAVFRITATHYATANQTWYDSVTNGCIIP
jgi:hypothetical protein